MILLNILQNPDGTIAWVNIAILLVVFVIGFMINRYRSRQSIGMLSSASKEWSQKFKHAENEYKSYRSGHEAAFRQQEKLVAEMTGRVKSLEGDIKVLAEEKNKFLHRLQEREDELKNCTRQLSDWDEKMKNWELEKATQIADVTGKLRQTIAERDAAAAWEGKTHAAEDEARKARAAFADIQRKTLEFDMRLKAASEYAAKVRPLEASLRLAEEKYQKLEQEMAVAATDGDRKKELQDAMASLSKVSVEKETLGKQLTQQEQVIRTLREELNADADLRGQLRASEGELQMVRATNAALQKELAERTALITQMTETLNDVHLSSTASVPDSDIHADNSYSSL